MASRLANRVMKLAADLEALPVEDLTRQQEVEQLQHSIDRAERLASRATELLVLGIKFASICPRDNEIVFPDGRREYVP